MPAANASTYAFLQIKKNRNGEEIKVDLKGRTVGVDYYESLNDILSIPRINYAFRFFRYFPFLKRKIVKIQNFGQL